MSEGGNDKKDQSALENGAQMASTAKSAIKAGKALAGAAKGAAAGPYGAAAGLLWENRKTVIKVVVAAAALLALPILFILMLPALIFGNLGDSTPTDVMNNNALIDQHMQDAEIAVGTILQESHDDVLATIQRRIDNLGSHTAYSITDPYDNASLLFNANFIISQFSASQDDYREIHLDKLKSVVNAEKSNLFYYEVDIWVERATDEDEHDITHYDFTVFYVGEDYFPDVVFALTDEQRELSDNYAQNLALFLQDLYNAETGYTHEAIALALEDYPYTWTSGSYGSPYPSVNWRDYVTSPFGNRVDPITGAALEFHTGLDIALGEGTNIHAVKDGVVVLYRTGTTGYGNHIAINHGNGVVTLYAHCQSLSVSEGDIVTKGQVIAKEGRTGRVTGPHLHLEFIIDGELKNPVSYLP